MRKLYLKIVVAIWAVMIVASAGSIAVVRLITPDDEGPERPTEGPRVENLLRQFVDRALAETDGRDEAALVAWFREDHVARRFRAILSDAQGNRLHPAAAPDIDDDALSSLAFVHSGRGYTVSVIAPERLHDARPRPGPIRHLIATLAFRPGYPWLILIIAIPFSVFLSVILARYLVNPLTQFERAGRRLSEGDFGVRIGPLVESRHDEIAEFAATFDEMAARIETLVGSHKDLLRDVSHELRSPLARVHAALSLARQRTAGAVDVELDRIEEEVDRLNNLIGKLLEFSRLDARKMRPVRKDVDLGELLVDVVSDSVIEARAEDKSIEYREGPVCTVSGDAGLLVSCFENIVRNAVRYTPAGTAVEVGMERSPEDPGRCRIEVRDHGPGLPADELTRVFDPFHKAPVTDGGRNAGSGIGLAIAQKAVALHDGEIMAANAPGGGLVISVSLPLSD